MRIWEATHRLLADEMEHIGGDVERLALNLISPASIVAEAANNGANVGLSHGDGLAIVERFDSSKQVGILLRNIGQLVHEDTSLLRRDLGPGGVEGLAGRSNSKVDILLGGFADRGDDLFSSGVDDFKLALVQGFDPFAIDEAVEKMPTVSLVSKPGNTRCLQENHSQANGLLVVARGGG